MNHLRLIAALSALGTAAAFAQPPGAHIVIREREMHGPGPGAGFEAESKFMVEMAMESKTVKGAPYSAQAVSETTQVLGDGTRISRKTSTVLARDSEGRTRREETLSSVGPWSTNGQARSMIFINDPVAQSQYVLDASQHTANKMPARNVQYRRSASADGAGDNAQGAKRHAEHAMVQAKIAKAQANVKSESLGNQTIAGVVASGTRVTRTIPVGEIGNDRPINVVSETWYSDDLQMVVMSKHSDPRSGDTTYTLSNLQRTEPAASLFTVPADYTVQENTNHVFVNKSAR